MIRTFCFALVAVLILAGCGSDNSTPITYPPKDTSALPDPFETHFPWNAEHEGLVTTESGLQYIVVQAGDPAGAKPGLNDSVEVHYDGRLAADGTKFDASYDRGETISFGVGGVIPGWTEVLQLMVPGDDWMVYLPSDIGYGERGTPGGPIGPNADLIFRVNLINTIPDETPGAEHFAANLPWDGTGPNVITTESGLQYKVLASGDVAGPQPGPDARVEMGIEVRHASDGRRLQSTWIEGRTQVGSVERLFPGGSEALQLMRPGDDWMIFIPAGPLGIEEDLLMRVNLIGVKVPQVSDSAAWERHTPWNSDAEGVQKTDFDVEYVVLEAGDEAGASPTLSDTVEVYYEGRLASDGATFDSAYARGESIEFGVTQVIEGWTKTLQLMRPGDRWLVYIPSEKGYGETPRPGGIIKPGDDLIFEMQLVSVR